mgnify:FL=1|tara:strand:- start:526 stop:1125 length:600 start_codon:yes stop_codon:yes gene_type:complete
MKKTFEITIPTDWSDVTIKKFIKYNDSLKDLEDERQIIIKTISILCDISEHIVEVMKLKDLKKIQANLQKLIGKPVNKDIINKIDINGVKYGFHPNLDDLTMGEFVDIETYAKENDIAKMMSVLYRPIVKEQGNRYDIEPYDFDVHSENSIHFEKLSINVGNAIAVFFWTLGKEQLKTFHQSSKVVEKNQSVQTMDGLQ